MSGAHTPSASPPAESRVTLAAIVRTHAHRLESGTAEQAHALRAIARCRTAALGGHARHCDHCDHVEVSYNSCRNRHCPQCQALPQARWLEARQRELIPVPYFHVVFTVPAELRTFFRVAPRVAFAQLFAAVAETLLEVAAHPKRLGAQIGFLAVLHTWTQQLVFHPHVHCVVPGGGLAPDGTRWIPTRRPSFFLPVRVLATVFRGKLLHKLEQALTDETIALGDGQRRLIAAARVKWVVYAKPPFGGPEQVLAYLGRYTHRIAISNHRLVAMDEDHVTFRWRDRADGNREKLATLEATTFLRRFLSHVLPTGLQRIRHYGWLGNGVKHRHLPRVRALLQAQADRVAQAPSRESWDALLARLTGRDPLRCPACGTGRLTRVTEIVPTLDDWSWRGRATMS